MVSLVVLARTDAQQQQQPAAILPLLVTPNPAVSQEFAAVFDTMQSLVEQQLEQQQDSAEDVSNTASMLTWSLHFEQLLWDIAGILDCASAKPGSLPAEVAAGVLSGVLEFMGHHGCWCSISWLLAEGIRAKLLKHAKGAATQRLQETKAVAWLSGGAESTGAMCAGFILDLAHSPPRNSSNNCNGAGCSSSSSINASAASQSPERQHISSTRMTLNAIVAAVSSGQQRGTRQDPCGSSAAASYHSIAAAAGCSILPSSNSSAAQLSPCASSASFEDADSTAGWYQCGAGDAQRQQLSKGWQHGWCQACNHLVLAITAVALVLLLLLVFSNGKPASVVSCQQVAAGEAQQQQLAVGCVLPVEPVMVSADLPPASERAGAFVGLLLYHTPFLLLLLVAVSAATRVCLVL